MHQANTFDPAALFADRNVFIVGSGPSLVGLDFSRLRYSTVIAVNHAYKKTPHTLHTFYDSSFLTEAAADGYDPATHHAHVLAGKNSGAVAGPNVTLYRRAGGPVGPDWKGDLHMGFSSALAAVNVARIGRASAVYLLGIDCRFLTADEVRRAAALNGNLPAAEILLAGADFAHHNTQGTTAHTMTTQDKERKYKQMAAQFAVYASARVFNCSPFSDLPLPFKDVNAVAPPTI